MTRKLFSYSLYLLSTLFIIVALLATLLSFLLKDLNHYTRRALEELEASSDYSITFDETQWSFINGIGLRIDNFTLSDSSTRQVLLRGKYLYVLAEFLPLFKKKLKVSRLIVEQPEVNVFRDQQSGWHYCKIPAVPLSNSGGKNFFTFDFSLRRLQLTGGTLTFKDDVHNKLFVLNDTDISLHRTPAATYRMRVSARHRIDGNHGTVEYESEFQSPLFGRHASAAGAPAEKALHANLTFSSIPLHEIAPYVPENISFPLTKGLLSGSVAATISSRIDFAADGSLSLQGGELTLTNNPVLPLPDAALTFRLTGNQDAINCNQLAFIMQPTLQLFGTCALQGLRSGDPRASLELTSGNLDMSGIGTWGALLLPEAPAWLPGFLDRTAGGLLQVVNVTISGPVSQNAGLDDFSMLGTVSVSGLRYHLPAPLPALRLTESAVHFTADRLYGTGVVSVLPGDAHAFDFSFDRSKEKPLLTCAVTSTVLGKTINDLLTAASVIAGQRLPFTFSGGTITAQSNIILSDSLEISADVDCTQAQYTIADSITKPSGLANTITISAAGAPLTAPSNASFSFHISDQLAAEGSIALSDDFKISGGYRLHNFQLTNLTYPFLPRQLWLAGTVSGAGSFALPGKNPFERPVSGTVSIHHLQLLAQSETLPLIDATATLSLFPRHVSVDKGYAVVGKTRSQLSGTMQSLLPPIGNLTAHAEFFDVDDFVNTMLIIRRICGAHKAPDSAEPETQTFFDKTFITVDLQPEKTNFLDWNFDRGSTLFSIKRRHMLWDNIAINAGNGTINGSVLYDLSHPDYFRLEFITSRSDVDFTWSIPGLREKQTITGTLDMKSRFSTNFTNKDELLNNMEGSFEVALTDGKINRFTLLSNILNLLNVARLLTLQTPEIVSQGMPFDKISAHFSMKNLTWSTSDFLLQGPAMNLSAVGNIYLSRNELDLTVGVQVLRTIAKLLGAIPYAGSKITGKGKSLTMGYFNIKGPCESPKVTPLPLKALDNALLKIFKSLLQIPKDIIGLPIDMINLLKHQETDNATID